MVLGFDWGAGDKVVPGFLAEGASTFLNPASYMWVIA
jgi:hypothetical protein